MNNFVFSGKLLRKPELRYTSDQTAICTSLLEFEEQTKERTKSSLKVTAFGKSADAFHKFQEGAHVLLEGSLRSHTSENPAGFKEKLWELNIGRFELLSQGVVKTYSDPSTATVDTEATAISDEDDCPLD